MSELWKKIRKILGLEQSDSADAPIKDKSMVLVSNQIICNNCEDSIYSAHRHDFVTCACGGCSVDGGMDYARYVGSNYTCLSIDIEKEALDALVADIKESRESGRNDLGIVLATLRSMRDHKIVKESEGNNWVIED